MAVDVPATRWQSQDGLSDFGSDGPNNIVDSNGDYLVDPSGDYIVDTGVVNNRIPATVWISDDSM